MKNLDEIFLSLNYTVLVKTSVIKCYLIVIPGVINSIKMCFKCRIDKTYPIGRVKIAKKTLLESPLQSQVY